jgi:hypothetical protein
MLSVWKDKRRPFLRGGLFCASLLGVNKNKNSLYKFSFFLFAERKMFNMLNCTAYRYKKGRDISPLPV